MIDPDDDQCPSHEDNEWTQVDAGDWIDEPDTGVLSD